MTDDDDGAFPSARWRPAVAAAGTERPDDKEQ